MSHSFKRILVTSALPYANGPIHLGHLAGAYLPADIYVRYQRLKKRDVLYICGSDEHGVPITIAAEKRGVSPQAIVDEYHERNKAAFAKFGMSFDYYGRTSSPVHHQTSQEFFLTLYRKGIFKKKREKQLYDPKAKMFLPDRYVRGECPICGFAEAYGDQCEKCGSSLSPTDLKNPKSALTGETPELRETEHWYIPLGDFQPRLEDWLATRRGWKPNVMGQVKSWLAEGLSDRAVTRDLSWGVKTPLPEAEGKVLYVWFDAPIGYISATKEWAMQKGDPELWKTYWQSQDTKLVHFIGKDNIVFHCIMFPAMLMAHGDYVLPDNVPANEFLNLEGNKLSTSRNYAVWLEDYAAKFEIDPLRYYLAANAPETKDSDFTWSEFLQRNNSELADILGNFINRTLAFLDQRFEGVIPARGETDDLDRSMLETIRRAPELVGEAVERFEIRRAVALLMDTARSANKYFNDQAPWLTIKENPAKCATTINICLQACALFAVLMEPVMPFSAEKLWKMLGFEGDLHDQKWDAAGEFPLPVGKKIGKPAILFRKIEEAEIQPEIERLRRVQESLNKPPVQEETPLISIDQFAQVQLRVATVLQAERIPKADKLLKLQIKIGDERRQIVAGIAQRYTPEELIGKKIIVVANLQPAVIRGIESRGMLLAAEDAEGRFSLLGLDREVADGAKIR
ncbi:MAG: methionine--tRNA ligase [candidate division KSB1 bacterium]|nr:methionine--tRNA ligase [candidate division KSB1 bacterium]MDZ7345481.1 methionine--tRNA ligase [candidate division KSB1 bacterium]